MNKLFILSIYLTIFSIAVINAQTTEPYSWTDPVSGTKYDFSSLKKDAA